MYYHTYGTTTCEGIHITADIIDNLADLFTLTTSLEASNLRLVSYNTQGVIVEDIPIPVIPPIIEVLKEREDITDKFFILFDFLPEHIKKELKIYIQK